MLPAPPDCGYEPLRSWGFIFEKLFGVFCCCWKAAGIAGLMPLPPGPCWEKLLGFMRVALGYGSDGHIANGEMHTEYASQGRADDGPELGVMLAKKVGARPGESPLAQHTSTADFRR